MNKVYRIIDANINRAKEGLRVVEDICRFVLDNAELTDNIKDIRHKLTKLVTIPDSLLVASRGSDEDVARQREVPQRKSTRQIFTANTKRVTEALRVMEEFLDNGSEIKDVRYLVYDLEKVISSKLKLVLPFENDLYVVSDDVEVLKKAIADQVPIVQLRDKESDKQTIYQKALELVNYKKDKEVVFILNDDPEMALNAGADGVHVGQEDMETEDVRKIVGDDFIIGRTTHNIDQALQAQAEKVNYISVGPVYATPTKPNRPAVGLEYVRDAAAKVNIPFVTIGGIDMTNINEVLNAGAYTIGIVRAADKAPELIEKIKECTKCR